MKTNFVQNLDTNIQYLNEAFADCGDIVARKIPIGHNKQYIVYISYIDGLANQSIIEGQVIFGLVTWFRRDTPSIWEGTGDVIDIIKDAGISSSDISDIYDIETASLAMLSGDCVILIDGCERAIGLSTKNWPSRGIGQPETEMVLQGSKEAFTETMRMNTALIRRRIRDVNLKIRQVKVGRRSSTDIAVVFIDGIVRPKILEEVMQKLNAIDIDAILDSGYIEQLIEDYKYSPFPQTQVTERPDRVSAAILEGRVAIVVDNSPFVILVPTTFTTFFQASEDYYQRFEIMSFLRILRYFAAFIAIGLPGLYIALTVYHPAMIPSALALKMAAARQSIPFPAVIEILLMELAFELLREAGIRLPGPIGSTLGIVGGLIIGQAAVEAGIVSPVVVIIVALAGIASFAVPQQSLVTGFRLTKFFVILLSAVLGLFGFLVAILSILTHLTSMKSFGIPYMYPYGCSDMNDDDDLKDSLIRVPLFKMIKRPFFASPEERIRMSTPESKGENEK